jgi:hypothetical protein
MEVQQNVRSTFFIRFVIARVVCCQALELVQFGDVEGGVERRAVIAGVAHRADLVGRNVAALQGLFVEQRRATLARAGGVGVAAQTRLNAGLGVVEIGG